MRKTYLKSLQIIIERNIKNKKEYRIVAKEENLLNVESLQYISGKCFSVLCRELQKKRGELDGRISGEI